MATQFVDQPRKLWDAGITGVQEATHNDTFLDKLIEAYQSAPAPAPIQGAVYPARGLSDGTGGAWQGGVRPGLAVVCRDGPAGRISRVLRDRDLRPTHIIVQTGLRREYRLPCSWVTTITTTSVFLQLDRKDLAAHPRFRPDGEIAGEIHRTLMERGEENIRAMVRNGIVELHGSAPNRERARQATEAALRICGVQAVRCCLHIEHNIAA